MKGKLSIIVESDTKTSEWLENYFQRLLRFTTEDIASIYIVPSDEVPYKEE